MSSSSGPWTVLFEALHSALIDELNERFSKEKPELGMPVRKAQWLNPLSGPGSVALVPVSVGGVPGLITLAIAQSLEKPLQVGVLRFAESLVKRVKRETERRGVSAEFSAPHTLVWGQSQLPQGVHQPGKVAWIPIKIGNASCFFSLGV